MNNRQLESNLRSAVEHAVPDVLDRVLSECSSTERKGTVITMEKTRKRRTSTALLAVAAVLLLVIGGFAGFRTLSSRAIDSIITLDVNPSIELKVNDREKVVETKALNADAQIILGDMDLKDAKLDVAMYAIIGSMLEHGYLNELANSVLVTVDSRDSVKQAQLQQQLQAEIGRILSASSFSGSVISQAGGDAQATELAAAYGISTGKAELILKLTEINPLLTASALAELSINDLNLLLSSSTAVMDVSTAGSASDAGYVGRDAAKAAALTHAGLSESQVSRLTVEMDYDDGRMVYEVEFRVGTTEYEYEIDAITGAVLKTDLDHEDDGTTAQPLPSGGSQTAAITESDAKALAFAHAGVTENQLDSLRVKLDYDDGIQVYDVEFRIGAVEYDYEIDTRTGEIRKAETDLDDDYLADGGTASTGTLIGEEAAKSAAFTHAGVSSSQVSRLKVELDYEDGIQVYEVEFHVGNLEYDYEIDAYTGTVLKGSSEFDD